MRQIYVCSAGAAKNLIETLRADFEAQWGVELVCHYGPVGAVFDKVIQSINSKTPCHATILTPSFMAKLPHSSDRAPHTRSLGFVETGLIFHDPSMAPHQMTVETLVQTLKKMTILLVPDMENSTGGRHVKSVLERLGLLEQLAPNVRQFSGGAEAVSALDGMQDEKAIAFAQFTEVWEGPIPRIALPFPEPYRLSTEYQATVIDGSICEVIETFVSALTGAVNASLRCRCGFV